MVTPELLTAEHAESTENGRACYVSGHSRLGVSDYIEIISLRDRSAFSQRDRSAFSAVKNQQATPPAHRGGKRKAKR